MTRNASKTLGWMIVLALMAWAVVACGQRGPVEAEEYLRRNIAVWNRSNAVLGASISGYVAVMDFDQALQVRGNLASFRQDLIQADDEIAHCRREMEGYPVPEDAVDLHAKLIDYLATSSAVLSVMMRAVDLPDDGEEAQYGAIVGEMHRLASTLALNVAELDQAQDDYARRHRISVRFRGEAGEASGD